MGRTKKSCASVIAGIIASTIALACVLTVLGVSLAGCDDEGGDRGSAAGNTKAACAAFRKQVERESAGGKEWTAEETHDFYDKWLGEPLDPDVRAGFKMLESLIGKHQSSESLVPIMGAYADISDGCGRHEIDLKPLSEVAS